MRRACTVALTATVLTGSLFATNTAAAQPQAATAHAGREAYNEKLQYLTKSPVPGMPSGKVQRRIYLASGNYFWWTHVDRILTGQRSIYLGAGWYTWTDWLHPVKGKYVQDSVLNPDNPAWSNASVRGRVGVAESTTWKWGSGLNPR